MAITLVQAGSVVQPATQPSISASGAGNLLVCCLTYSTSGPPAVTTANWIQAVTVSASGNSSEIWYLPGSSNAGGVTGITISNWTGAANYGDGAQLLEFSGVAATSPLDQTGTGTSGTPTVSTGSAVTGNDELAVSVTFITTNPAATQTLTPGTGFTSSGNIANGTSTVFQGGATSYAIIYDYELDTGGSSSGTTISDAVSHTAGVWINTQVIATFLESSAVNTSPAYASSYDTTAVAGTGTWVNPANAESGPADGSFATWTAP